MSFEKIEKADLIEAIRNEKRVYDIEFLLYFNEKVVDEDVIRVVYSRINDFEGKDLEKLLSYIAKSPYADTDMLKTIVQRTTDAFPTGALSAALSNKNADNIVVKEAYSRINDFEGKDLELLFYYIAISPYADANMLKTIVQRTTDVFALRVLPLALINKNADNIVVKEAFSRINDFEGDELECLFYYIAKSPYADANMLKTIVQQTTNLSLSGTLYIALINKNADNIVVKEAFSRINDFEEKDLKWLFCYMANSPNTTEEDVKKIWERRNEFKGVDFKKNR